jgi:hypothetical protein
LGEHFATELPGGEAVGAPFIEVLLADGARGKFRGQEGPNRRQGVEPGQEGPGGLVVGETVVEFVAQGLGEAGDFRGLSHRLLIIRWRQTPLRGAEGRRLAEAEAREGWLRCGGSLTPQA